LTLKDPNSVFKAYLVAPALGLAALWFFIVLFDFFGSAFNIVRDIIIIPWMVLLGGVPCALVELFVVTPILLGFSRYRWPWLNGWSAAAVGFLAGGAPCFALCAWGMTSERPYLSSWGEAFEVSGVCGLVGLIAAVAFRVVAVQTVIED
jgi:hypothetical protein